jgi:uncharacterized coiled-coil DUF342 family protein
VADDWILKIAATLRYSWQEAGVLTMSMDKSIHDALEEANQQIDELRRERDEQAALVAQMREQVADYDALIERLTEAFAKLKTGHELLQQRGGEMG